MSAALHPVNIQPIGDELAIVWNNGGESYFKLEALRRACPCAACGGEPDVLGNVERPLVTYVEKSFQLRSCRIIGGYSVQMTWEDGHDTGLYTYKYLQALGEQPE